MGWGPGTHFIRLHRHKGGDPNKDGLQEGGLGVSGRICFLGTASQSRPHPRRRLGLRQDRTRDSGLWAFSGHPEERLR